MRYFAFDQLFQTSLPITTAKGNGGLKTRINQFFEAAKNGDLGEASELFYAYIDPRNERSLFISRNVGFQTVAKIATQTFSRVTSYGSKRVQKIADNDKFHSIIVAKFSNL